MTLKVCTAIISVFLLHWWSANGDIIATSIINECLRGEGGDEIRDPFGDPCTKKLVVAMTADTEEVAKISWLVVQFVVNQLSPIANFDVILFTE